MARVGAKIQAREGETAYDEEPGNEIVKTTVNLPRGLMEEARIVAREGRTTLRGLVEAGLRRELRLRANASAPFKLRDGSFRGEGVQPGIDLSDWDQMLSLIYGDRG